MPLAPFAYPARPNSAGPQTFGHAVTPLSGLPDRSSSNPMFPAFQPIHTPQRRNFSPVQIPSQTADGEEGKGEHASQISLHLRTATRARSMSPMSEDQQKSTAHVANTLHAVSLRHQEAPPVLSPQPVNSLRNSSSRGLSMSPNGNGTTRSERVDLLERLVDLIPGEEGKSVEEVLRDIEKAEKEVLEGDKTLPVPPVPSGKLLSKRASAVPHAKDVFGGLASVAGNLETSDKKEGVSGTPKSVLRPSPMARPLAAEEVVSQGGQLTADGLQNSQKAPGGLDALEQRLLREVGTRKPEQLKKPTLFSLGFTQTLPAPPMPTLPPEPVSRPSVEGGDSEISTFALASAGFTEHQVPMTGSNFNINDAEKLLRRSDPITREKEALGNKRKEGTPDGKSKESEAIKLRKEAKGRVADWLDGLAMDAPRNESTRKTGLDDVSTPKEGKSPGDTSTTPSPPSQPVLTAFTSVPPRIERTKPKPMEISVPSDNTAGLSRPPALRSLSHQDKKMSFGETVTSFPKVAPEVDCSTAFKHSRSPAFTSPTRPEKPEFLQGKTLRKPDSTSPISPPPTSPKPAALASPRKTTAVIGSPTTNVVPLQNPAISQDLPAKFDKPVKHLFPPSSKPLLESKYDVRSARGGKGGIATSVAALWSSLAEQNNEDPPPKPAVRNAAKRPAILDVGKASATPAKESNRSFNRPSDANSSGSCSTVAAEPQPPEPRNGIKAASVPAVIVPSLAKPHISSTASLARPALSPSPRPKPPSLSPLLDENPFAKPQTPAQGDLAFGQARLKDLIKKYQEAAQLP